VTNEQLYLAIGVPIFFNGFIALILAMTFSAQLSALREHINSARTHQYVLRRVSWVAW
jgi:hypothetical protein